MANLRMRLQVLAQVVVADEVWDAVAEMAGWAQVQGLELVRAQAPRR